MSYRVKDQFLYTSDPIEVGQQHTAKIFVPALDAITSKELLLSVKNRFSAGDLVTLYYHGSCVGEDHRYQRLIEVARIRVVEIGERFVEFRHIGEIERYEPRIRADAGDVKPEKPELKIEKRHAGGYAVRDAASQHDHEWFGTLEEAQDYVARESGQSGAETVIQAEPAATVSEKSPVPPRDAVLTVKRGFHEYLVQDEAGNTLEAFKTKKDAEEYVAAYGSGEKAEAA